MKVLRDRPEIVLIFTAALFLGVNLGPWGPGVAYLGRFLSALALQQTSGLFPLTWGLSVALFVSTWWLFLRRTTLGAWRSFIVGGTLPFAAVSLFEIPYFLFNRLAHPW